MALFSKEKKLAMATRATGEAIAVVAASSPKKCPFTSREPQYGRSFLIALGINCLLLAGLVLGGQSLFTKPPVTQEKMIAIDMSRYEVPQKAITSSAPAGNKSAATSSSVKGTTTGSASTPYVGGVEEAEQGVEGVQDKGAISSVGSDGEEAGIQSQGQEDSGAPGSSVSGGGGGAGSGGYVDLTGYMAKLNSIKQKPLQATKRHISGTVTYAVTFNASGDVVGISLLSSSGYSILDNAGRHLIQNGGRITNTTGRSTTETVSIVYR